MLFLMFLIVLAVYQFPQIVSRAGMVFLVYMGHFPVGVPVYEVVEQIHHAVAQYKVCDHHKNADLLTPVGSDSPGQQIKAHHRQHYSRGKA